MKYIIGGIVAMGLIIPSVSFAAATINSVSVNGASPNGVSPASQVDPGGNIVVSVAGTLTDKTKWKGTDWGFANNGATPTCTNTKNAKDGTQNNQTGVFTETFIAKAPKAPGLYNLNLALDQANNCGQLLTSTFTYTYAIRVGANTTPPTIAAHSDVTVPSTDGTGATVTYTTPTATDAFGNPIAVSCTPASGGYFLIGTTMVMCSAHDAWSNQASPLFFNVQVLDTTPPTIAPHANVVVILPHSSDTSGSVTYTAPTATDNVDSSVSVSCTPASGATFNLGSTTVACSAHDAAGNVANSSFVVGVYAPAAPAEPDTTPPTIAPHADIVMVLGHAADTTAVVIYTAPTATDNIDGPVAVSCTPASGSAFGMGSTTVVCSAHDTAGNQASTSFVVGVYPFVPQPITLQESTAAATIALCGARWDECYQHSDSQTFSLGLGSTLQGGSLTSVTIDLDEEFASFVEQSPWIVGLTCSTDAANTAPCADWVPQSASALQNSPDGKQWKATFNPVGFNAAEYYWITLNDNGLPVPAYGSATQPYWLISGLTQ